MRQQVCVVVGSALRSEWLLGSRGRCRAVAGVGGAIALLQPCAFARVQSKCACALIYVCVSVVIIGM